jgi:hypothetical protein
MSVSLELGWISPPGFNYIMTSSTTFMCIPSARNLKEKMNYKCISVQRKVYTLLVGLLVEMSRHKSSGDWRYFRMGYLHDPGPNLSCRCKA